MSVQQASDSRDISLKEFLEQLMQHELLSARADAKEGVAPVFDMANDPWVTVSGVHQEFLKSFEAYYDKYPIWPQEKRHAPLDYGKTGSTKMGFTNIRYYSSEIDATAGYMAHHILAKRLDMQGEPIFYEDPATPQTALHAIAFHNHEAAKKVRDGLNEMNPLYGAELASKITDGPKEGQLRKDPLPERNTVVTLKPEGIKALMKMSAESFREAFNASERRLAEKGGKER